MQFDLDVAHALHEQMTAWQQLVPVSVRRKRDAVASVLGVAAVFWLQHSYTAEIYIYHNLVTFKWLIDRCVAANCKLFARRLAPREVGALP